MFLKYLLNSLERLFVLGFAGGPSESQTFDGSGENLDGTSSDLYGDKGYKIEDFFIEEQLQKLTEEQKRKLNELLEKYNKLSKSLDDNRLAKTIPEQRIKSMRSSLDQFVIEDNEDIQYKSEANDKIVDIKNEVEIYETVILELTSEMQSIKNEIDMVKILERTEKENSRLTLTRINELITYFEEQKLYSNRDESLGIDLKHVETALDLLYKLKNNKNNDGEKDPNYERLLQEVPNLREFGDYSIDRFISEVPISERLKYVTKERKTINENEINNGDVKFHITYDFGGNHNDELEKHLRASMIFPESVGKIEVGGTIYNRDGFQGEFFDENGEPLLQLKEGTEITLLKQEKENITIIPDNVKSLNVIVGEGENKKTVIYNKNENGVFISEENGEVLVLKEGLKISWEGQETLEYKSGTLRTIQESEHYKRHLESEPTRVIDQKLKGILEGVNEITISKNDKQIVYKRDSKGEFRVNGEEDGLVFDVSNGGVITYVKDGKENFIDLDQKIESLELGIRNGAPGDFIWDNSINFDPDNVELDISQMVETSGGNLSRFSTENGPIGDNFKDDFFRLMKLLFPFAKDFIDGIENSLNGGGSDSLNGGSFDSFNGSNDLGQELANFCKSYSQEWDNNNPMCGRNVYNALHKFGKFPGIKSGHGYMWAGQLEKRDDFQEITDQYDVQTNPPPPGAIISYKKNSGGSDARKLYGHVEIALGGGQYYFGITSSHPGGSEHNPKKGSYRIFLPKSSFDSVDGRSHAPSEFNDEIDHACNKTSVPRNHLIRLVHHESKWNPKAENSSTHAYGLGQIIPGTWAELGYSPSQKTDPKLQLEGTARYLEKIKRQNNCTWEETLAYYNTGPAYFKANINLSAYYSQNPAIVSKIPYGTPQSKNAYFIGAIAYYNDISYASAKTRFTGG